MKKLYDSNELTSLKDVINILNKKKAILEKNKEELNDYLYSFHNPVLYPMFLVTASLWINIGIDLINNFATYNYEIKAAYGSVTYHEIITILDIIISISLGIYIDKKKSEKKDNKKNALQEQIDYIQTLINNKNNIKEEYISYDNKKLENILELYYNVGYNDKKYSKYFKKGILKEKLSKEFDENQIKFISDCIEEKNRLRVRKK